MQNKIALLGLGEIGSRHLQALTAISNSTDLYCVDPSLNSTNLARSRISQIVKAKDLNLFFHDSIKELPSSLDLVIIATSSDIRLKVLKEIALKSDIKNILFEKVLFQKINDLLEADSILKRNRIKSWVNCPRRLWPVYSEVKSLLKGKNNIKFKLVGGSWGMACNLIHYIDIFEWISGSRVIEIDIDNLDQEIFESKRRGFFEFTGMINAKYSNENKMSLISAKESNSASIASEVAADIYKLNILNKNIEDNQNNSTRFLVIGERDTEPSGNDKTSIIVSTKNNSGALYELLEPLSKNNVSMTRIESRPSQHNNWEYIFYLDLNGHIKDQSLKKANEEIKKEASLYRFLGSYPAASKK